MTHLECALCAATRDSTSDECPGRLRPRRQVGNSRCGCEGPVTSAVDLASNVPSRLEISFREPNGTVTGAARRPERLVVAIVLRSGLSSATLRVTPVWPDPQSHWLTRRRPDIDDHELRRAEITEDVGSATMTCCLLYTSPSPRDGLLSRMP